MSAISLVHLVRPAAAGTNTPLERPPVLILLHGVRSSEAAMHTLAPSFDPRFVVVSLRSPLTVGPGQYAWFTVQFTPDGPVINAVQARAAWERVPSVIDEVVAATGADPARVYLGGFSQGGIVTLATLLTAPERIAGALVMSGRLLPEVLPHVVAPERLREKPLLWVHGTRDDVLGIEYLRAARAKLRMLPLSFSAQEFDMGHVVGSESLTAANAWLAARLDADR